MLTMQSLVLLPGVSTGPLVRAQRRLQRIAKLGGWEVPRGWKTRSEAASEVMSAREGATRGSVASVGEFRLLLE